MNTPQIRLVPDAPPVPADGFVLRGLQVFNWGPFNGWHHAEFDAWGSALIGATGSGKTTLVDALMTLLVDRPRYNLASTGGVESDRDLMSYLRGDAGVGNRTDASHVARPDKTASGVQATFVRGAEQVQLTAVFWMDGPGRAAGDRKDVWLFAHGEATAALPDLRHWLALLGEEGARGLKHQARLAEGVQVFDTKSAYLAQVRRFFAVSDNAFRLLNRATGLKQLHSIDDIFRELVLDDRAAFDGAARVVQEFDQLVGIRQEVETARQQIQTLRPVAVLAPRHEEVKARIEQHRQLLALLPWWFARAAQARWQAECAVLQARIDALETQQQALQGQIAQQEQQVAHHHAAYLQAGGSDIESLRQLVALLGAQCAQVEQAASQYQGLARRMGWSDALTAAAFAANRQGAAAQAASAQQQVKLAEQAAWDAGARHSDHARRARELGEEIAKICQRPGSNIPSQYQDWRADLAAALGLGLDELPFVAELIEVRPEHQRWRGAIERALGGERLRLLVPPAAFAAALDWVNRRHNRLLVRLLDPTQALRERPAEPFADGYVRKLRLKEHPLKPVLQAVLSRRDRHCVDSAAALARTEHAMTVEGSFSDAAGRYEKDDRRDLREGWLTGFDNRDQLQALAEQLAAAEGDAQRSLAERDAAQGEHETLKQTLTLLLHLAELRFEQIDVPGQQRELAMQQQRLAALESPGSALADAKQAWEHAQQALRGLRTQDRDVAGQLGAHLTDWKRADKERRAARDRAEDAPPPDAVEPLRTQLPVLDDVPAPQLAMRERDLSDEARHTIAQLGAQQQALEIKLVNAMNAAKRVDTGALANDGTELTDVPAYLTRLHVLDTEDLPAKRQRFQTYLNASSDQGVTQLLQSIDENVQDIEQRIEAINTTLAQVAFQPGRHLQLVCQRVVAASVKALDAAQRQLRAAAVTSAADEGEAHFQALRSVVQQLQQAVASPRTQAARALLDPRWRVQFAITVVDSDNGQVLERRTGSQGGSGGEKEVIAIYVLTASLSYALCARQPGVLDVIGARPRFATMVLDEAFSRTSQAVAARIVAALRAFGLHPLFVTPNKELRLLREHTRRAILVHREGSRARLASLSWEEIDQHRLRPPPAAVP